ncbi:glycosyltransferase family 4 protein, partial [Methylobacterium sp. WL103]
MRVAYLAWDYPPAPSGLSTAAREIAESLAEAGADVTVFTLDRTGC